MKDAFILDLNFLKEQNISPEEFLLLIELLSEKDEDHSPNCYNHNLLEEKGFIKKTPEYNFVLREKSKLLLDFLSIESSYSDYKEKKVVKKSTRIISEGFDEFIEEYRSLWKGLKSGAMGSPMACKEKMLRWMKENPNYTKEDILKAAKIYINSLNNYQYLQAAHYFIYKKDGKDENSRLSAFIEEKEVDNTDWTVKLS